MLEISLGKVQIRSVATVAPAGAGFGWVGKLNERVAVPNPTHLVRGTFARADIARTNQ
jgi:hypothetical protein